MPVKKQFSNKPNYYVLLDILLPESLAPWATGYFESVVLDPDGNRIECVFEASLAKEIQNFFHEYVM